MSVCLEGTILEFVYKAFCGLDAWVLSQNSQLDSSQLDRSAGVPAPAGLQTIFPRLMYVNIFFSS